MEIAILSAGPSLANLTADQLGTPDVIIAINTAIDHPLAEGCDWWAAHDTWKPPLVLPTRAPRLGMVTCGAAISEGQALYVPYHLYDFRSSRFAEPVRITTSAAVYWAAELIAARGEFGVITLHGCDMRGTSHWNGGHEPEWTEEEWVQARACLRKAISRVPFLVRGWP